MSETRAKSTIKPAFVISVLVVAAFAAFVVYDVTRGDDEPEGKSGSVAIQNDTHVLDRGPDNGATLVEFLDFECEACGAFYPLVEQMREQYDGKITFAVRYFPLDGHRNSRNAAYAVESAARQGKIEQMYSMMFRTQNQWGDQDVDHADTFRGFAQEIGLDMDRYDRDVASASVKQRVERDYRDGLSLGVTGTPSFFLNNERLEPRSTEDFYGSIDKALDE